MRMLESAALLSALLFGGATAHADAEGPPPHRRPPEAAFTACASAQESDACTVSFEGHEMQGKCVRVPEHIKEDAGKLVCAPPHPPGGPPPRD